MVAASGPAPAARIVGSIAASTSSSVVQLRPSAFDAVEGSTHTLPTRSSDPGALAVRLADAAAAEGATLPIALLLPADAHTLSTLVPHLSALAERPIVLHFGLTSADHAPITAGPLRSAGLPILFSRTAAEVAGLATVAARAAQESGRAVVHFFEVEGAGSAKAPTKAVLNAAKKVADFDAAVFVAAQNGHTNGANGAVNVATDGFYSGAANGAQNGDVEMVDARPSVAAALETAFAALPASLRVAAEAYVGAKTPASLVVSLSAFDPSAKVAGAGVLSLAQFQPRAALADLIPSSVERVVVLEQAHDRPTRWAPLFLDLLAALNSRADESAPIPRVVSRTLGADVETADVVTGLTEALAEDAAETGVIGSAPAPASVTPAPRVPTHERAYTKLLEQTFGDRLRVGNAPDGFSMALDAAADTSPAYALGRLLGQRQARTALETAVRSLLADAARSSAVATSSREALAAWIVSPADADRATAARNAIAADAALESLRAHDGAWTDLAASNWIIGSDAWAYDLGASGVHHALASGLDVNLLIIDAAPYPNPTGSNRGKKDVGLYALNYGNAYVASVAVYGDYAQTARALVEADKYHAGPSVVLAYLPGGESDEVKALDVLKQTKRAVDSGHWPLYRYDPTKSLSPAWPSAGDPAEAFQLDSERIKADLRAFVDRQSHLSLLAAAEPTYAPELGLDASYGVRVQRAHQSRALKAYERLTGAVDGPPLLVLYASDGGTAEKVARRLVMRARARGLGARVEVLDAVEPDDLALETNVVFISSVAGQGEFPQNGRQFWKKLQQRGTPASPAGDDVRSLESVKFAVFGMGDSHYWPRAEDAKYYNKPGLDLDARLVELSCQRLVPELGLGDDQDPDGWQTGYKAWEAALWVSLGVDTVQVDEASAEEEPITNEHIKIASDYLRGTIAEGLVDTSTGALAESDGQLTKFHGIYQQDDRDIRDARKEAGLEPAYSFMIRIRLPAGVCKPDQWLQVDAISSHRGNGTFKLTTRQAFQYHGVVKGHLKPAMQEINKALLDTIAACGDVNRNVQCTANPSIGKLHAQTFDFSARLSEHLLPHTTAYGEIWLDKKLVGGDAVKDFEPLYGSVYLPRKFKIAVAVPPHNDVDIFTNDVGFIAIVDPATGDLAGFNVTIGGGMGVTHGNQKTYPRLGDIIGYVDLDRAIDVAEKVMLVQRDNGDRTNRKHARLKYTIDTMGLDVFKAEVEKRLGFALEPQRPFEFTHNTDAFGWAQGHDGNWHFTAFIENGRVEDSPGKQFKTALREIAKIHTGVFRLTANQHLVIADVTPEQKPKIQALLEQYKLDDVNFSALRLSSSACVAFPTCGLAMAESERYLPVLIDKVEKICEEAGLRHDDIVMRMTGCPNGCARPWAAEVAFVGKAPGQYAMMLGGGYHGQRLNKIYRESVDESEILAILTPMLKSYAKNRLPNERFGDFTIRQGWIAPTTSGAAFYDKMAPEHAPITV